MADSLPINIYRGGAPPPPPLYKIQCGDAPDQFIVGRYLRRACIGKSPGPVFNRSAAPAVIHATSKG